MSKKTRGKHKNPGKRTGAGASDARGSADAGVDGGRDASTSRPDDFAAAGCVRQGWIMIAGFLTLGLVLESFHLVKLPYYLDVHLRRELWTLAHAHGTLLGAICVLFGLSLSRLVPDAGRRVACARFLRIGAMLVPLGFFLGALGGAEGDPSLFILLVPAGALLALLGLVTAIASR